ncbi:hypothetical protein Q3G72_013160 [Acer saccharum]|nr:hypothetical protein Q3G72_013160 [Acer saccharum]
MVGPLDQDMYCADGWLVETTRIKMFGWYLTALHALLSPPPYLRFSASQPHLRKFQEDNSNYIYLYSSDTFCWVFLVFVDLGIPKHNSHMMRGENMISSEGELKGEKYFLVWTHPIHSIGFPRHRLFQGGAAGEDRVQAVCSEEHGLLFCAIYDGFNGRDAADFLAGTLYENIMCYSNLLDWESKSDTVGVSDGSDLDGSLHYILEGSRIIHDGKSPSINDNSFSIKDWCPKLEISSGSFRHAVLDSLQRALIQAENDFLYMVEQEMEERPDLVSVGSCVLVVLLHGNNLYTLNLGDSRAVLATYDEGNDLRGNGRLKAVQLTESHTVENEDEKTRVISEHPDDPKTIVAGKVKGKLKVTRALGVGYLKKEKLNDALMGILRVRNLVSPPYISTEPSLNVHRISKSDHFVIVGSDGLFDFFTNEEAVKLVHSYILRNPSGDPAKFLLEQLVERAAECAGFSMEELMNVPAGRRRKYHDDVTVIVVILGSNQRTTKASTCV